ncbi:30S ribosomal protein S7 [candidate division MSBL1 archaeon SCGC-AAA382A13]|uniref:Small ribosomal subunit protein uS7 n=1 Tax=candidate division MSBL1 archaeon SCGC-AAA382A13 TaxID=1698279 RepID=A0A133VGR0_9EURY|nr:30S ribosomal protein S7 [candidate division MSBL1 archaeon SCGC-AAA382A13]
MPLKYFGKWSVEDVKVNDRGLRRYIRLEPKLAPHSAGRQNDKRFNKANVPIVERLMNKLMRSGPGKGKVGGKSIRGSKNCGDKQKAYKIVRNALEIIEEETNQNPIQVVVDAIQNSAPREETTKISYGGITYHEAVDSAPQRRLDIALKNLADGAYSSTFKSEKSIEECLAEELILASRRETESYGVEKKAGIERIAKGAR